MVNDARSTVVASLGKERPLLRVEATADFETTGQVVVHAPAGAAVVLLHSAPGEARRLGGETREAVTELLEFALGAEAWLSREPAGAVSLAWVGREGPPLRAAGRRVLAGGVCLGVVEARYEAARTLWELPPGALTLPGLLVAAVLEEELARLGWRPAARAHRDLPGGDLAGRGAPSLPAALDWDRAAAARLSRLAPRPEERGEEAVARDYVITVVDYCTGDPVPGARVSSSHGTAVADAQGRVTIGPILPGTRVDLRVAAEGYQDSHLDSLHNEHFIA